MPKEMIYLKSEDDDFGSFDSEKDPDSVDPDGFEDEEEDFEDDYD